MLVWMALLAFIPGLLWFIWLKIPHQAQPEAASEV
jgi:hypothetical protein